MWNRQDRCVLTDTAEIGVYEISTQKPNRWFTFAHFCITTEEDTDEPVQIFF